MRSFVVRRFVIAICSTGLLSFSSHALASAFQIWEQDGASEGNYHAGYAAKAADASTAFYNPAGIMRIKNQQLVVGAAAITTDFKYRGSVNVQETVLGTPLNQFYPAVTAQGGTFNLVPDLHYVAPICDRVGFGFSVVAPFGLKTDYGRDSALRYAGTYSAITIVDISPDLAMQVTDQASLGAGFDIQKAEAEFDSIGTLLAIGGNTDTQSINRGTDTGYGFHIGGIYDFTPQTRAGLSYHSQVVHHLSGTSKFYGPIATILNDGPITSNRTTFNMTLPPYTALSLYHKPTPQLAVMASAIFTQWSIFKTLYLHDLAGAVASDEVPFAAASNTIQASVLENYHNSWNFAVGADYSASDTIILRGGLGYDQTPVRNAYRNVELPDNDRYVVALGGHVQATKTLGLDVGWMHLFVSQARVNPPPQAMGDQIVTTDGRVKGGADVLSGQITWDIT